MLTCILRVWCPLSYPCLRLYFSSQNSDRIIFSRKLNISLKKRKKKTPAYLALCLETPVLLQGCFVVPCTCSQGDKNKAAASKSGTNIWLGEFLLTWDMINCPVWHHQGLISKENENSGGSKESEGRTLLGERRLVKWFFSVNIGPLNQYFITACLHTQC